MRNTHRKNVSRQETIILALTIAVYFILFMFLHIYLELAPLPLIIIPFVAGGWILGIKRGIITGVLTILASMTLVLIFHSMHGKPLLGFLSVLTACLLGIWSGWTRKLYDSARREARMLAEEHQRLLREIEGHREAEQKALWSEYFLKAMSDSAPLGILAINHLTNEVQYCNDGFLEIWNLGRYKEKIKPGMITRSELLSFCLPSVKDAESYLNYFRPTWDVSTISLPAVDIEFTDGRIIRHFTTQIKDQAGKYLGRLLIYEDVTARKKSAEMLKRRYDYEHLVYTISNQFVNAPAEDMDEAFNTSLRMACEFLGMDRGYLFQTDSKAEAAYNLYEWRSSRISSQLTRIEEIKASSWPGLAEKLKRNETIVIPDIDDSSLLSQTEKENITLREIRSVALVPITFSKRMAGFLGFDSLVKTGMPEDIDSLLQMLGDIFTNAFIHKQNHAALLESGERFRLLVQHSADTIGVIDKDGYIKYFSPSVKDIIALDPEERRGKSIFLFIHPDDVDKIKDTIRLLAEEPGHPPVKHYLRLIAQDNTLIHLESIYTGQLDNPAINGIIINSRNISQHIALQEELRSSRNFLDAVINRASDPMFVKDSNHRFIMANDAFCRMSGFTRESLIGKCDYDLVPKEEADQFFHKDDLVLSKGEIQEFEQAFTDPQGNKHIITSNETLFRDEKGGKYIISNIRDETKRKVLEHEINNALLKEKELNELKSKFISMVSHEYRTPLAVILSSAELLELFSVDMTNEERAEHLAKIKKAVDYLTELLSDVLLINRTESGRLEFAPAEFELVEFCIDMIKNFNDNLKYRIELKASLPSKMVTMDKKLLRHIFLNLFSNACKYSDEGSTVEFDVCFEEDHVDFEVRDKGIGIPEQSKAQLFEPFYRAENVMNISGSGLGLSIVKNCVDIHGGTVSFESIPGKGTTFSVTLPDKSTNVF